GEVDDGEMKSIAKLDKPADLLSGFCAHGACIIFAVIGDNANAVSVQSGEGGDQPGPEMATHLEKTVPVEDKLHQFAHIKKLAAVFGNDADQFFFRPINGI